MNNEKNKKIEEILGSLDHHPRTPAPDFFYTRLKARMEKKHEKNTRRSWVLRPAFAFTVLVSVLLVNAAVILRTGSSEDIAVTDTDAMQSIAAEYSLDENSSVYDLTQE